MIAPTISASTTAGRYLTLTIIDTPSAMEASPKVCGRATRRRSGSFAPRKAPASPPTATAVPFT